MEPMAPDCLAGVRVLDLSNSSSRISRQGLSSG